MATWLMREPRRGPVTLWCDRMRVGEYQDVPAAEREASRRMDKKEDSLIHEEPDGYQYRLRVPRRRGWRAPRPA